MRAHFFQVRGDTKPYQCHRDKRINFPGMEDAMKASIAINKLTGISFTTQPAISAETFDFLAKK